MLVRIDSIAAIRRSTMGMVSGMAVRMCTVAIIAGQSRRAMDGIEERFDVRTRECTNRC